MSSHLLLMLVFGLVIGGQVQYAQGAACPSGWTHYESFCYQFYNSQTDWATAELVCTSINGNLASIRNSAVHNFLSDLIYNAVRSHVRTWVGGNDAVKDGVWLWSDGSWYAFNSWSIGEPNNTGGSESCMEMNRIGRNSINDENCTTRNYFICQKHAAK